MLNKKQMVVYVVERRKRIKQEIIDGMGGKCCKCNYNTYQGALELHHLNPENKDFSLSQMISKSLKSIVDECKKCVLLCSNCHKEFHAGFFEIPDNEPRLKEDFTIRKRKNQYG